MDNTIFNADCTIGMAMLAPESIDICVTSPPYDNLREYNNSSRWGEDTFYAVVHELFRVIKRGGVVVWIVNDAMKDKSETGSSFRQALYFMENGFLLHDTMIWQKISPFQHRNRYIQSFEYMFVFSKECPPKAAHLICDRKNKWGGTQIHGSERQKDGTTRPLSDVQKSKTVKEWGSRLNIWEVAPNKANKTGHPAVFPEQLAADHILSWSNEGDIVLDPFLGSGTTAIAAHKVNRKYVGYEIDPNYFAIAKERIRSVDPSLVCESISRSAWLDSLLEVDA